MMGVSEYLQQHGPAFEADLHGPCGDPLRVAGQLERLRAEGLARKRGDQRWEMIGAARAGLSGKENGMGGKAVMRAAATRALEPRAQRPPVLAAEELPVVEVTPADLEFSLAHIKHQVARAIEVHIHALIGNPADLDQLTKMLKQLSRRIGE